MTEETKADTTSSNSDTGSSDEKAKSQDSESNEQSQHPDKQEYLHIFAHYVPATPFYKTLALIRKIVWFIVLRGMGIFILAPLLLVWNIAETTLSLLNISLDGPSIRSAVGLAMNGAGFAYNALHDYVIPGHYNKKWREAMDRFNDFMEKNGLDKDMEACFNGRFLTNMSVYDDVQREIGRDRPGVSRVTEGTPKVPSLAEGTHFMRFATAAYGFAVIASTLTETADQKRIKEFHSVGVGEGEEAHILNYVNCKKEDVVCTYLNYGGSLDLLRHYVVMDHSAKAMVFAVRGTFSISEIIADWVSFGAPFCGGTGHVAMSEIAKAIWSQTKEDVLKKLKTLPEDYELVFTGHSLGAGVACLLTILLHHEKCITTHKVRCMAFAPPPVFYPLSAAEEAVQNTVAYIHGEDTVPFTSVNNIRRFFSTMTALDTVTRHMSVWDKIKIDWRYKDPTEEMVNAMKAAEKEELRTVEGAEPLCIPARAVIWLRKPKEGEVIPKRRRMRDSILGLPQRTLMGSYYRPKDVYLAEVCDAKKLSLLPIRVPSSQRQMLTDHLASKYEVALGCARLWEPKAAEGGNASNKKDD